MNESEDARRWLDRSGRLLEESWWVHERSRSVIDDIQRLAVSGTGEGVSRWQVRIAAPTRRSTP